MLCKKAFFNLVKLCDQAAQCNQLILDFAFRTDIVG
jgi:hypothetical protein